MHSEHHCGTVKIMLTQILVRKYHFASGHYHPVSVMMERYGSRIKRHSKVVDFKGVPA